MKKLIFYAVALLSVASLLNGCKKDDGNESKGPNVEGVLWFEEVTIDPSMTAGFYLKDGNMSYCAYAKSDEGAAKLSEASGKTVKTGNIVLYQYVGAYTIVKNEDGTSGTIKYPSGKIEYSGLTETDSPKTAYSLLCTTVMATKLRGCSSPRWNTWASP